MKTGEAFYMYCVFQKLYFILISAIQKFIKETLRTRQLIGSAAKHGWLDWWEKKSGSELENITTKNKSRESRHLNPINQSHLEKKKKG